MLIELTVDLSLDRHAFGLHAVEWGLVEADCSLWSIGVVRVHGDDSHWVGGVVAKLVQSGCWTVGILAVYSLPLVEKVEHRSSNCDTKSIAQGQSIEVGESCNRLRQELGEPVGRYERRVRGGRREKLLKYSICSSCDSETCIRCAINSRKHSVGVCAIGCQISSIDAFLIRIDCEISIVNSEMQDTESSSGGLWSIVWGCGWRIVCISLY